VRAVGFHLSLMVATALAGLALLPPVATAARSVPGRVIVVFTDGSRADTRAAARDAVDGALVRRLEDPSVQVLEVGGSLRAALRELRDRRGVRFAEPDYIGRVAMTPNDPLYASKPQSNLDRIGMPAAWDVTTGSAAVKVGVLDTGIDLQHPDLAGQLDVADGYDFVDDGTAPDDPADGSQTAGHGTHVAGIIGAASNNGQGVAGVSWGSKLIPLRVCGSGTSCFSSDIADGIMRAGAAGARIVNASIEGLPNSRTLADAIAANPDLLVVVAAGNTTGGKDIDASGNANYPCSYPAPNLICVAASSSPDGLFSGSNYGATSVDLAAPGVTIWSTIIGDYGSKSGTSMAAPHVAGAAALLLSDAPTATVAQLKQALMSTVGGPSLNGKVASNGRLNVAAAVNALPGVTIDDGPAGTLNTHTAAFAFHATPAGTGFECRVDDAAWTACASPYAATAPGDGTHAFSVRASAGGVTATRAFSVDTTGPAVTIDGPGGPTKERSAAFSFSIGDGVGAQCSLDGGAFAACGSPFEAKVADGSHTLVVRAFDSLFNVGAAERRWSVDATAPALAMDGIRVTDDTAAVTFHAEAGASTTCELDGAAAVACSSGQAFGGLRDGPHEVVVLATDAVGNVASDKGAFRVPSVAQRAIAEVRAKLRTRKPSSVARMKPFKIKSRAPSAGQLRVSVLLGSRTVFTGSGRASRAGRRLTVKLRRAKAASTLRRRSKATLTLSARFTPRGSRHSVSSKSRLRLKR
jgi:hypothetical protein